MYSLHFGLLPLPHPLGLSVSTCSKQHLPWHFDWVGKPRGRCWENLGDVVVNSIFFCYTFTMPRHARIDNPGLLQHVIARGVNRSNIFLDDTDREMFVERLSDLLNETHTTCYAWALLNNHFHLLVVPTEATLATFMRRLLTGYAVVFNLRHGRSGHVFQNRYKSIVCDGNSYLLELIRYIHLNPIRAGIINDLTDLKSYSWCGHRQLLGLTKQKTIYADEVLSLFSRRKKAARELYLNFLVEGLQQIDPPQLSHGGRRTSQKLDATLENDDFFDERILGGSHFAQQILDSDAAEHLQPTLEQIVTTIAAYYDLDTEELSFPSKEKQIVQAKSVICFLAIRCHRQPGVAVAKRLGYSSSAASYATKRGKDIVREDKALQLAFDRIWR